MQNPKNDPVSHPAHYTSGNIEVIDFLDDQQLPFCLANVIKYVCRAGKKTPDPLQDLEKAAWYLNHYIEWLKKQGHNETWYINHGGPGHIADYGTMAQVAETKADPGTEWVTAYVPR